MSGDIARQKRRLAIAMAINGVCAIVALAAVVGEFALHIAALVWLFGAAMVTGFAAQGWLILGLLRARTRR